MKIARLEVTATHDAFIQRYLGVIAQQISEGYTSGMAPDGSCSWDLSEQEV